MQTSSPTKVGTFNAQRDPRDPALDAPFLLVARFMSADFFFGGGVGLTVLTTTFLPRKKKRGCFKPPLEDEGMYTLLQIENHPEYLVQKDGAVGVFDESLPQDGVCVRNSTKNSKKNHF